MKDYKKGSQTVWDCKYHLVWVTKYRYPVLVGDRPGDVGHRARELLREIARRARGYWVATSGNVTDEVWRKYIEEQKPEPPDDHFKVV